MASRAGFTLAVLLMVLLAASANASAGVRSFKPVRATESALTFKLRDLSPAAVRRAELRARGVRRRVPLRTIRRAARRGVLRVRAGSLGPRIARAGIARAGATSLTVTTCTSSSSSYAAAIAATPGLVSHWRLGESAGSVACDQAQRNAGTYGTGVALGQTGAVADGDRAAGFNGTSRVAVASSTSLAAGAGVSVEAWIKPSSTASQTVARKDGQYLLRISSGKLVARVWLTSGSYVELTSTAVVQTSAFQHIAMTYDRTALRVFRNGALIGSRLSAGTPAGSSKALLIGSSDGYDGFTGSIDEVAIYNAALTAQQVAAHSSAAQSTTTTADGGSTTSDPAPAPTLTPTAGCGWGTFSSTGLVWPGACWRPYADTSPFNKPIPATPTIRSGSDALIAKLLSNGYGPGNITAGAPSTGDYSHPVVYSRATDPLYTIHCVHYGCDDLEGRQIRIPVGARPAGGGDGHLAVVDQSTGYEYDFYESDVPGGSGGTLNVGSGGVARVDAAGSGLSLDLDGDGRVAEATAARFALLAGLIRVEELAAGRINHALFITIPCGAQEPRYVAPATKGGTLCADNTDRIPMGARLRLNMTAAEIDALAVPTWKKTILHAMRTYGAYMGDTGGSPSFGVMLESSATYTAFGVADPKVEFAKANGWVPYNGYYVGKLKEGVPWSRLQVLDWSDPANR